MILEDNEIISHKVSNDETVYLTLKLLGGTIKTKSNFINILYYLGKGKKKKKNFTTKKKNKHKHVSEKLATLKYFEN